MSIAGNSAINDRSSETFAIPENGTTFYVNDASTTGDEYTTAAGNNRATGKRSIRAPLPLLTTLLREYSLNATSNVFVDTGNYSDFAPIELSGNPAIGSGQGVTITGRGSSATTVISTRWDSPARRSSTSTMRRSLR